MTFREKLSEAFISRGIPFTQYMLPDGRTKEVEYITSDRVLYEKAMELLQIGMTLEAEVLTTGHVSITVTSDDRGDLFMRVFPNEPGQMDDNVLLLINRAYAELIGDKIP